MVFIEDILVKGCNGLQPAVLDSLNMAFHQQVRVCSVNMQDITSQARRELMLSLIISTLPVDPLQAQELFEGSITDLQDHTTAASKASALKQ